MAQQNINYGAYPNDITAETIRDAFIATQNNFTQLFDANAFIANSNIANIIAGNGITIINGTGPNVTVSATLYQTSYVSSTLQYDTGTGPANSAVITDSSTTLAINIDPGANITVDTLTVSNTATLNVAAISNATMNTATVSNANITQLSLANTTANTILMTVDAAGTVSSSAIQWENGNLVVPGNIATSNLTADNVVANVTSVSINANTITSINLSASNIAGTLTTSAQPNITSVGTLTDLTVTGTVTGGTFSGNGSGLSAIAGANVTGQVANAAYADSSNTASSATTAGTVTTASQPNITSVGTLTSLTVSGNITGANVIATSPGVFIGNGSRISNLNASNISAGTLSSDRLSGIYNININGNATTASMVTSPAQSNITSVGTLTSLAVSGDITSGGNVVVSGDITANTLTATTATFSGAVTGNLTGTAQFATGAYNVLSGLQPNITAVGNLSTLRVIGNTTLSNVSATTINANTVQVSNIFTQDADVSGNFTVRDVLATRDVLAASRGVFNSIQSNTSANVRTLAVSNTAIFGGQVSITGNVISSGGLSLGGSANIVGNLSAATARISGLTVVNSLISNGLINANSITVGGSISATGNLSVAAITSSGNANIGGAVSANGNISTANTIAAGLDLIAGRDLVVTRKIITMAGSTAEINGNLTVDSLVSNNNVFANNISYVNSGTGANLSLTRHLLVDSLYCNTTISGETANINGAIVGNTLTSRTTIVSAGNIIGGGSISASAVGSQVPGVETAFELSSIGEIARLRQNGAFKFAGRDADPADPEGGDVYYNNLTGKLRVYNGVTAAWDDLN